ncbi:hypothetical protein CDAR_13281 [Caerostris darwini]|uniref:Uncharacterized protein n=1 Tax=Caerostris darwini TaxID=1538125 RepID=A0AAV4R4Q6_9ARAC|nr:hypothetical protein CDAR_13281 [Caerostris darwini]
MERRGRKTIFGNSPVVASPWLVCLRDKEVQVRSSSKTSPPQEVWVRGRRISSSGILKEKSLKLKIMHSGFRDIALNQTKLNKSP